jgi:hypothetical protein
MEPIASMTLPHGRRSVPCLSYTAQTDACRVTMVDIVAFFASNSLTDG